jgi:galactose mutarotase-like enzyme
MLLASLFFEPNRTPGVQGASDLSWGRTPDGAPVEIYVLRNAKGLEARITNYGAAIVGLKTPDRFGHLGDVVLGFDSIEEYTNRTYLRESPYFGAAVGRYANRIKNGRFALNGQIMSLSINKRPNHLHGGFKGFDKVVWEGKPSGNAVVRLTHARRTKARESAREAHSGGKPVPLKSASAFNLRLEKKCVYLLAS